MKRTHHNGELRISDVGKEVCLEGWAARIRNLGGLVFIDLRDREGITQIVCNEKDIRNEYVLRVYGKVVERSNKNKNIPTGDIEIAAEKIEILNTAKTTPLIIADETDALEDTRLKYRYLDLRRPVLQKILKMRHEITLLARNYLSGLGFWEIETPVLCKSTPEGARDYLVPSRVTPGSFYALPQSPQIYKQLLMIAGMDKYFQIARCFRDEDLRADRQPEFTQIDIEMSFCEEEDIYEVVEGLMKAIVKEIKHVDLLEFDRLSYQEAMSQYGTDKPDIRFALKLEDISALFANTEIGIFKTVLENKGIVNSLKVPRCDYSRKQLKELEEVTKVYGAKALAYLKVQDGALRGPLAKFMSETEQKALFDHFQLEEHDLLLMVADQKNIAQTSLGQVRLKLGRDLHLIDENELKFLWVTDFPMFEYSEQEHRYVAAHHPFTAPQDVDKMFTSPEECLSRAFDLVLNGYELLSGSIRIHDQETQKQVFKAIGLSEEEARERFGFFLDAFQYGTPPHGGVGIGLERLIMILAGTDNIRDVMAFPKTASAADLMSEAPSVVDERQLEELGIEVIKHE